MRYGFFWCELEAEEESERSAAVLLVGMRFELEVEEESEKSAAVLLVGMRYGFFWFETEAGTELEGSCSLVEIFEIEGSFESETS